MNSQNQPAISDGIRLGVAILSFFMPMVGIVAGLFFLNEADESKKAAGRLWLIVGGVSFALSFLLAIALFFLLWLPNFMALSAH